jgi:hypothetical protein
MKEIIDLVLAAQGEGVTRESLGDVTITVYLNGTKKMVSWSGQYVEAAPPVVEPVAPVP